MRLPHATQLAPIVFLVPFLAFFVVFMGFGTIASLGLSFTDWQGVKGGSFVGVDNYGRLLANASFQKALLNTALVWLMTVPILSLGGLALAWFIHTRVHRFRAVVRSAFLLPVLPSLVVVGIIFLLLLDPTYGLIGQLTSAVGLTPINIRTDAAAAIPILSAVIIWRWLGYNMIIQLAGLQTLPVQVIEAAQVDGAGAWSTFWRIVVPMSKPVLLFTTVLSTIGVFNLFDEPFVIYGAQGGPAESGLLLGPLLYREAFQNFDLGYASSVAYATLLLVFAATVILLRVLRD